MSCRLLECLFFVNFKFRLNVGEWADQENGEMDAELPFAYANFPFLAKIHGGQVDTVAKNRRRRGIYDECCLKPCTKNEIYSFCK